MLLSSSFGLLSVKYRMVKVPALFIQSFVFSVSFLPLPLSLMLFRKKKIKTQTLISNLHIYSCILFKSPGMQCCQLSDFVARFSDFSDPLSDFFFLKRLATNLATFGQTLATFQMWPVLSCEREILSYTSPCVCSDQ